MSTEATPFEALEQRVRTLEQRNYIAVGLAVVLGFSTASIWTRLSTAQESVQALQVQIAGFKQDVPAAFNQEREKVASEFRSDAQAVIDDLRKTRFNSWLDQERAERVSMLQYGGSYQQANTLATQSINNPLTNGLSCPQGFKAVRVGRILTPEPQETHGTGADQFACVNH